MTSLSSCLAAAKPITWRGKSDLPQYAWTGTPIKGTWLVLDLWAGYSGLCLALLCIFCMGTHFYVLATDFELRSHFEGTVWEPGRLDKFPDILSSEDVITSMQPCRTRFPLLQRFGKTLSTSAFASSPSCRLMPLADDCVEMTGNLWDHHRSLVGQEPGCMQAFPADGMRLTALAALTTPFRRVWDQRPTWLQQPTCDFHSHITLART